jgi:hypothetical protein
MPFLEVDSASLYIQGKRHECFNLTKSYLLKVIDRLFPEEQLRSRKEICIR